MEEGKGRVELKRARSGQKCECESNVSGEEAHFERGGAASFLPAAFGWLRCLHEAHIAPWTRPTLLRGLPLATH